MTAITFNAAVKNNQLTAFSTWQGRRALFVVNLHNRPSFYLNNAALMARMQYGEEILLWSGLASDEAERLLNAVTHALKQAARRQTALKSALTLVAAAVVATGLYAGTRAMNAPDDAPAPFVQRQAFAHNPAMMQAPAMPDLTRLQPQTPRQAMMPAPQAAAPQAGTPAPPHETADQVQAAESQLAANLQKAAGRSLFTVPLSSGHARTLYVFADPSCPNCQNLEPLFEALSTQYNVLVFPTTAFGGDKSAPLIKPVLCLPPEQRKAAWQKLFAVGDGMLHLGKDSAPAAAPTDCDLAGKALGVNDVAFKSYRFPGTPWVIADDGRHVPQAVMRNPDDMVKFMSEHPEK
ncbi:hypothetical protein ASE93_23535 [Serratia sp. Leaf50]|nr:hypothetical protein ASE93_23535 [Serratia sp. Leaf50]